MKDILEATLALFLFKPYTNMPRVLEIGYGILAWLIIILIADICI
jgi:hypothetical protein